MDARTTEQIAEDGAAPAIVIRASAQVGQNRAVEMQFAVPLDMTVQDLNAYMDKMTSVMDRQNNKGLLEVAKATLAAAHKNLETNREQRAAYESKCRIDFVVGNRRGEWRATDSQKAQLSNFDGTTKKLVEEVIPKLEADIADLEGKIAEGV